MIARDLYVAGAVSAAVAVSPPSPTQAAIVGALFILVGIVADVTRPPKDPKR